AVERLGPLGRAALYFRLRAHRALPPFMYLVQAVNMWRMGSSLMPVIDRVTPSLVGSWPALRWKLTQSPPLVFRPSWQRQKLSRSSALIMVEGVVTSW